MFHLVNDIENASFTDNEKTLTSHERKTSDTDLDRVEWTLDAKLKVTLENGTQDKIILVPFKPGIYPLSTILVQTSEIISFYSQAKA